MIFKGSLIRIFIHPFSANESKCFSRFPTNYNESLFAISIAIVKLVVALHITIIE